MTDKEQTILVANWLDHCEQQTEENTIEKFKLSHWPVSEGGTATYVMGFETKRIFCAVKKCNWIGYLK